MKKIVFLLLVLSSFFAASAQEGAMSLGTNTGAVRIRGGLYVDSVFYLPKRVAPSARLQDTAAVYYNTSDSTVYVWSGRQWLAVGRAYTAGNGVKLSSQTFKLGDYLSEHTTIKGALRAYDFIIDSVRNFRVNYAGEISLRSSQSSLYLDNGSTGYSYFGNYPTAPYVMMVNSGGVSKFSLSDFKSTYISLRDADSSATVQGKYIYLGSSLGSGFGQNIYAKDYADATGDSVAAFNSSGKLVNKKVTGTTNTNAGSSYRLVNEATQTVRTIAEGFAVKIDSTSTSNALTVKVDSAGVRQWLKGVVGIGKIEFVAESNSATYQNDSLIGKEILGVWIEGSVIGSTVRSTANYYTFDAGTGTLTFNNGIIAEDDNVLIYFGKMNLTAGAGVLNDWTPGDIAGLLGWWDFTETGTHTLSSGRLSQVNDLSGNGNHVAQATFANMPNYNSADGGSADFPSSRLTNLTKSLGSPVSGNYTLYVLVRKKSSESFINSGEIFITNDVVASNGIIEKTSTWGNGLWSGYDGTNSTNAVVFSSDDYELFRASIMQGNAVQFHINDECPSRTFYEGAEAGSFPDIDRYHFGTRVGLGTDFSIKEAIAVADDANVDTDKAVWTYMRAKHSLVSKQYVNMMGDSHIFGSQSGSGGTTGSPAWLVLMQSLGFRTYNNGLTGSKVYDPAATSDPEDFHNVVDTWIANGNPATGWHVIMYGTNDLAADIANPAWKTNYKAGIQKIIDAGYDPQRIIICSPPYTTNPAYDDNVNDAAAIAEDIATEMGLRFADVRQAMITAGLDCYTVVGGDTIHGNDAIHAVIASTIQAQIY